MFQDTIMIRMGIESDRLKKKLEEQEFINQELQKIKTVVTFAFGLFHSMQAKHKTVKELCSRVQLICRGWGMIWIARRKNWRSRKLSIRNNKKIIIVTFAFGLFHSMQSKSFALLLYLI